MEAENITPRRVISTYIKPQYFGEIEPIKDTISENNKESKNREFIQWRRTKSNQLFPETEIDLVSKAEPGFYNIKFSDRYGWYMSKKDLFLDELFELPNAYQESIIRDIKTFWQRKDYYKKYNYTYKRGLLLTGSAGCGKSSLVNLISFELINNYNGIVFQLFTSNDFENFINFVPKYFSNIQVDTPIICIIEDIETLCMNNVVETELLNFLDGTSQLDNIVTIATTNYPEKLKDRLTNRPSRFDRKYEIKLPDSKTREFYFRKKLHEDDLKNIDINYWVKETNGLTLAHLSEIIKSVCIIGNSFEEVIKIFDEMKKKTTSVDFNKETKETIGFTNR